MKNRAARIARIEISFPKLKGTNWRLTSRPTKRYNCIAWAVGDTKMRWDLEKGNHWPNGVAKTVDIGSLVEAYKAIGFSECTVVEGRTFLDGYENVVLYEMAGEWLHAAKLKKNGMWSSKLGSSDDIEHPTPESLSGYGYGKPKVYMRRNHRKLHEKKRTRKPAR